MRARLPLLVVIGPTASGKSALALRLAEELNGEILSGDSMQVYRGMDIGTAKPTAAERARVPHHLVDILDIDAPFSAADFTVRAAAAARDVCARGRLPILAGGTGLYIELLLSGGPAPSAPADAGIREKYFAFARREGNEALWVRLRALDPETAAAVHPNNVKRVVRALEIYELTGRTKSEQDRAGTSAEPLFDPFVVRLGGPREVIYARIDRRFDQMLGSGLLDEVRALYGRGLADTPTASQAIGYKELFPFLRGEAALETCVEAAKRASRRYAKRQETYFARIPAGLFLEIGDGSCETSVNIVKNRLTARRSHVIIEDKGDPG